MLSVAILAAGKGTRMASSLPKVLHKISGKTLLQRVINSCNELNPDNIFIIVGHNAKEVQDSISCGKKIKFIFQDPQLGTGHAIIFEKNYSLMSTLGVFCQFLEHTN